MNTYIDNIENVLTIYEKFCEYLETKPTNEKQEIIERMNTYYNNRNLDFYQHDNLVVRHEQSRILFRSFLTGYVILNPDLTIYKQEIVNMSFDSNLLEHAFEVFKYGTTPGLK